jgi:hypothetical protein
MAVGVDIGAIERGDTRELVDTLLRYQEEMDKSQADIDRALSLTGPATAVTHSANQTINASTRATVAFNTDRFTFDVLHDTSTNNSRLTIVTPGRYLCTFTGEIDVGTAANPVRIYIMLNGSIELCRETSGLDPNDTVVMVAIVDVNEGDYFTVEVDNTMTSSRNVVKNADFSPEFRVFRIGDRVSA